MINNGNRNDNCVTQRIQAGNRAYFTNFSTLKSKIISRAAKRQIHKTLLTPAATHGAEIWTLTVTEENVPECSREKQYAKFTENNIWRIRYSEEINALLKGEDIVRE
jgi:hypothetical protein